MWVREPCSVWLLGGQGGQKGCCGERTWESSWVPRGGTLFCSQQSDRATETPALAPDKQIFLVLLEEPSWVLGAIPERG